MSASLCFHLLLVCVNLFMRVSVFIHVYLCVCMDYMPDARFIPSAFYSVHIEIFCCKQATDLEFPLKRGRKKEHTKKYKGNAESCENALKERSVSVEWVGGWGGQERDRIGGEEEGKRERGGGGFTMVSNGLQYKVDDSRWRGKVGEGGMVGREGRGGIVQGGECWGKWWGEKEGGGGIVQAGRGSEFQV